MKYLDKIDTSKELRKLSFEELNTLAAEIRAFLLEHVSKTGGHLASNLGIVEITIAIHNIFDSERDRILFDVGHQAYVHKILTGRKDRFSTLRTLNGLSGFMQPEESDHDAFTSGHASSAVSEALGIARAAKLQHQDYYTIAVVGDGASSGGIFFEGMNDAGDSGIPLIVILNDNSMSISENVGGLSKYLSALRIRPAYFGIKKAYRRLMRKLPGGQLFYLASHRFKQWLKRSLIGETVFEQLGFCYLGPVDGHDIQKLSYLLSRAKEENGPVLIHAVTVKGKGYAFAENDPTTYHGVGPFDPSVPISPSTSASFSSVFGTALTELADKDERICAITAAMPEGTGLVSFRQQHPDRFFDVGITEEHAVSMAAGMAKQGMVPVVAIYSTFLQRSYDMLLQDVALQKLHVVFCIDRSGLVGEDGATHQGIFDIGFLKTIPGLTVFSPSNYEELRMVLHHAVYEVAGPVAVRYPRGAEGEFLAIPETAVICAGNDVTLVTYGITVNSVLKAAKSLNKLGISADIIRPLQVIPLDYQPIIRSVSKTGRCIVIEEQNSSSCLSHEIGAALLSSGISADFRTINTGESFVPHGNRDALRERCGLDSDSIVKSVLEIVKHE